MTKSPTQPGEVEAVMAAIHALLPLDGGSEWAPTFSPTWPKDYSRSEVALRRAVATAAILALDAHRAKPQ